MRPLEGSISSDNRPRALQRASKRSNKRVAALQCVIVDKPEAAGEERSFAGRQAVVDIVAFVAQNEFVADQKLTLDGGQLSSHPRIVRGQKTDERNEQQAGIEPLGAVGLHEAIELAI